MNPITIVAKGPSAEHAQEWIDGVQTDVAVINESGILLRDDQPIQIGFFTHSVFAERMRPLWDRIPLFSGPSRFEYNGESEKFPRDLPKGFPREKHEPYRDWCCCGDDASMIERIIAGGIVHHHTTIGAHHWLVKRGYRHVRIIGVDGGKKYASGMSGSINGSINLSEWREIHRRFADIVFRIYGAETEWFK